MARPNTLRLIGVGFLLLAVAILAHQALFWGVWWTPAHFYGLHHESLAIGSSVLGLIFLASGARR